MKKRTVKKVDITDYDVDCVCHIVFNYHFCVYTR